MEVLVLFRTEDEKTGYITEASKAYGYVKDVADALLYAYKKRGRGSFHTERASNADIAFILSNPDNRVLVNIVLLSGAKYVLEVNEDDEHKRIYTANNLDTLIKRQKNIEGDELGGANLAVKLPIYGDVKLEDTLALINKEQDNIFFTRGEFKGKLVEILDSSSVGSTLVFIGFIPLVLCLIYYLMEGVLSDGESHRVNALVYLIYQLVSMVGGVGWIFPLSATAVILGAFICLVSWGYEQNRK